MTTNGQSSPAIAVRSAVLEMWTKLEYSDEVLIVVFILEQKVQWGKLPLIVMTHFGVLSRNFDIIKLAVLEIRQPWTEHVQWLRPWTGIELLFIPVPPTLQSLNILILGEFVCEEVLLVLVLLSKTSIRLETNQIEKKLTLASLPGNRFLCIR
jgi:hypothetical protein